MLPKLYVIRTYGSVGEPRQYVHLCEDGAMDLTEAQPRATPMTFVEAWLVYRVIFSSPGVPTTERHRFEIVEVFPPITLAAG